ncbi:MAG: CPBP family intramembrane metalloprotease, partial [Bacteroidota bacterium]|nr:CPBP family intramembrane metalloprotease [Bacteroidota bacterium]
LFYLQMIHNNLKIELNRNFQYMFLLSGLFFLLPDVIIEELIFRGYCFKKTINRAGIIQANIIFAFLFVAWHWLALNAWGNYALMLGLLTTGLGHILFATALIKSRTLYFPIGIHLGNNWVSRYIFSYQTKGIVDTQQTNDSLFFIAKNGQDFSSLHIMISYLITIASFLIFTFIIWKWTRRVVTVK